LFQQLRQLGDVAGNASRLIARLIAEHCGAANFLRDLPSAA
jgi:hypothetical protein